MLSLLHIVPQLTIHFIMNIRFIITCLLLISVVILALNSRKSGQIANKGFMMYYGRYRSKLEIMKSPKQNFCLNLVELTNSQPMVHNVMKKWSDCISLLQAN